MSDGVAEVRAEIGRSVVDDLIEERAPVLYAHPLGRWIAETILHRLLCYEDAKAIEREVRDLSAWETFEFGSRMLQLNVAVEGMANVPRTGPVVIAPNHPTGIADGVALFDALKDVRPDLCFFANRDTLRVAPGLADMIIPVEWVNDRRSHARSRDTLVRTASAFREHRCVVLFPAGRLAHMTLTGLRERPWQVSVINLARKFNAPIVPLYMGARNSALFYAVSQVSNELRDVTLFRELLNKKGAPYTLRFGAPIATDALGGEPQDLVADLQYLVEHDLPRHGAVARLGDRQGPRPATLWGN